MSIFKQKQFLQQQIVNENSKQTQVDQVQKYQFKKSIKIAVIGIIFSLFLTYRFLSKHQLRKNCVIDNLHQWTFILNRIMDAHGARFIIGFGQILMDVNIGSMTIYWMIMVKNFRYPAVNSLFQYGRQFMLKMMTMPFESYVVWFSPGFPGFTVYYEHTSDYFFSGHTGTLMILYLESRKLNFPKYIQFYFLFTLVYMIIMLLVARVHYTIDIFGGIIFSLYFYRMVENNLSIFDQIANSPYKLIDIVKQKVKSKLSKKQDQGTSLYDIQHY